MISSDEKKPCCGGDTAVSRCKLREQNLVRLPEGLLSLKKSDCLIFDIFKNATFSPFHSDLPRI